MKIKCASLVFDCEGDVLVLDTLRGGYQLPGGRPKGNETFKDAAARELYEETGLKAVSQKLVFHGAMTENVYCYVFLTDTDRHEDGFITSEGTSIYVPRKKLKKSKHKAFHQVLYEAL